MRFSFFLLLCVTFTLLGDELTVDPPTIWDTECLPCGPTEPCFCPPELEPAAGAVVVNLRDPLLIDGVLTTDQGGVLSAPGLRIQAQEITYTRQPDADPPVYTIACSGNLLVDYKSHTLTGDSLFYDFNTHTGSLLRGKTAAPPWFVGGEEIILCENGDLLILNGYLTTSETGECDLVAFAPRIVVTSHQILEVYDLKLCLRGRPLFSFPKLKLDLKNYGHSPIGFNFGWGGFLGSHAGIRYQLLSWHDLDVFARFDYYMLRDFGLGIESAYSPPCSCAEWYTRNYFARDIAIFNSKKRNRYRFDGTYFNRFFDDRTSVELIYDFVSDGQFASDYQRKDFDLNTAGRTQLTLHHQENSWLANLFTRVRVNSFQSINQELPTFAFQWHPFELGSTGIISENFFTASYLDYVFSDDIKLSSNRDLEDDFHSGRFEARPRLYRPFYLGPVTLTPEAGFVGIGYTNSRDHGIVGQAVGDLALKGETALSQCFGWWKHVIEPYAHYHFLTTPTVPIDDVLIFTTQDAYDRFSLLRVGMRNALFTQVPCGINRPIWLDIWTNAFFATNKIPQTIQKGYFNLEWMPYPTLLFNAEGAWNFEENLVDFFNERMEYTLSENVAFSLEYRHRSRFDWRKADFYNFLLETVRNQQELLDSPLSDRRDTLLARLFFRPNPDWTFKFEVRHGFHRTFFNGAIPQPNFFEYQAEVGTLLFQHWRVNFNFERFEAGDLRFSMSLKLDPGPPPKRKACPKPHHFY